MLRGVWERRSNETRGVGLLCWSFSHTKHRFAIRGQGGRLVGVFFLSLQGTSINHVAITHCAKIREYTAFVARRVVGLCQLVLICRPALLVVALYYTFNRAPRWGFTPMRSLRGR